MKKIGQGYYYNVYDLGNGRVVKNIKSRFDRFFTICKLSAFFLPVVWSEFSRSEVERQKIPGLYKTLQTQERDLSILGNPKFINETDYEQDLVIVLDDALKASDLNQQKKLIDLFIESIFSNWKQGFSERVFNFTINNGLDKNGKVVLLDFDEITFEKSEALKRINNKRWLRAASLRFFEFTYSKELKDYYIVQMEKGMTEENLNKYWK